MNMDDETASIGKLVDLPNLADALEGDQFRQFLDHVPFGVAVSKLSNAEAIVYANPEFERLTDLVAADLQGKSWSLLAAFENTEGQALPAEIEANEEYIGTFHSQAVPPRHLDAWSNTIVNENGLPVFRLVALVDMTGQNVVREALTKTMQDKDTLLRELQHRVKNNLQMITALIRMEARNIDQDAVPERFDRLAGRVDSLALLYQSLSEDDKGEGVDLGVYVSQIASAVMAAHAPPGIRLALKVDTWPVSINVAMPAGLVVNELMTNALKHAFTGRDSGEIVLESLVDEAGCVITVADNGIGLQAGAQWPKRGKLSALIVKSLEDNVGAKVEMTSSPDTGMTVKLFFARQAAETA